MNNQPASGNGPAMPAKTLDDLADMAIMLAGVCDGLDPLYDTASLWHDNESQTVRRARNAMTPYIEALIIRAHELSGEIERTALAAKREGRG
ncbi:hypothetical protein [Pararhodobacter aggregans]